ncbi:hypothetical protein C1H46_030078 [Malus baccata]|uniref:Uncharacterized protein n=1 Tax=Malus baccata TaxID=106549 RepID=A0A540LDD6_MALBA|nr:hypothetical protein C1H46_030078 [Malus baccata]
MESPSSVLSSDDATAVKCSICMEGVSDNCGRTIVKLQCSHLFHLGELIFIPFFLHAHPLYFRPFNRAEFEEESMNKNNCDV